MRGLRLVSAGPVRRDPYVHLTLVFTRKMRNQQHPAALRWRLNYVFNEKECDCDDVKQDVRIQPLMRHMWLIRRDDCFTEKFSAREENTNIKTVSENSDNVRSDNKKSARGSVLVTAVWVFLEHFYEDTCQGYNSIDTLIKWTVSQYIIIFKKTRLAPCFLK